MHSESSTHLWIGTFAQRLLQLQPGLSATSAINCAVENFHRRHEVEPLDAAERSAQKSWSPRRTEPAPADDTPPSARYQQMFNTEAR